MNLFPALAIRLSGFARSLRGMRTLTLGCGLVLTLLATAGCATKDDKKPKDYKSTSARFYLESASSDGTPIALPFSGVRLTVNSKPVVTEGDIVNVELVEVELGKCLMFELTPTAARDLYRMSVAQQGRRLALFVDGLPLGARRIDGPMANGTILVFAELVEADLPILVNNLKKSAVAMQKEIARKK